MKRKTYQFSRRQVLKAGLYGAAGLMLPWKFNLSKAHADPLMFGLSDPALQPKFANFAPNAMDPGFMYNSPNGKFKIAVQQSVQMTGLVGIDGITPVPTTVWGYGENGKGVTWPGRTFEIQAGQPVEVMWQNKLLDAAGNPLPHLLPVDTSLHWCYSLPGYEGFSIPVDGVPIVTHLHGGHTDSPFDGNPEYFFSPGWWVRGPRWQDKKYTYGNDQQAGTLWYHDHALGITRLNVYAGMAGFYIVRDEQDTGLPGNPLGLPTFPYELAFAIQDRMFWNTGELFYPANPGEPAWDDFIPAGYNGPVPSALAEFFGDHMVVNGVIWPKTNVERRNYRMRLLNGCDSRFLAVRFRAVPDGANTNATDLTNAGDPLPFYVIGSDQGLAASAAEIGTDGYLLINPGERYDVVFDFSQVPVGSRVIMENIGGDAPFGGDLFDPRTMDAEEIAEAVAEGDLFTNRQTDRIMAFDVVADATISTDNFDDPGTVSNTAATNENTVTRIRKVALFEGTDEYGRLQPLLGTAEPGTDYLYNPIYDMNGVNQLEGSLAWHSPTTENPAVGATEIWEVYNATMDAHPVHLHLVHFEIMNREGFTADAVPINVLQHNGATGSGFRLANISLSGSPVDATGVEKAPKDMVTAYPGEVTRIKATFDKPGRYVWHCHILSHEDHEMMRVLHVGPGA